MIQASVSDIQKNPRIMTASKSAVSIIDKRKNEELWVYIPKQRINSSVSLLAGKYKNHIPQEKQNIDFSEVRKIATEKHVAHLTKKYKLTK